VLAGGDGDLELGADAVGAGDQHRILVAGRLEVEDGAETAEIRGDARAPGRGGERPDGLDEGVPGVDVDARVLVGETANGFLPRCNVLN